MQQVTDLWNEAAAWLSLHSDIFHTPVSELWRDLLTSLWDWSLWLNGGNKGLIIALVFLVVIVDRILKRPS